MVSAPYTPSDTLVSMAHVRLELPPLAPRQGAGRQRNGAHRWLAQTDKKLEPETGGRSLNPKAHAGFRSSTAGPKSLA